MRSHRAALVASGVVYLAVFAWLGHAVAHGPPSTFDRSGASLFGEATPLAIFASESGLFPVYFGIAAAAVVAGIARRAFLGRAIFLAATLFAVWKIGDAAKLFFARTRPASWLWVHERSASYPSGHAGLAIAGYGLLAAYAWNSDLPRRERFVLALALLAWVVTIDWSRLALGAHYPTDLIGGTLLALGVVQLGRALFDPLGAPVSGGRRSASRSGAARRGRRS